MNTSQPPASLSRRHFVSTALGAAMSTQLAHCAVVPGLTGGSIDAHVHVWTPDAEKYPLAAGYAKKDMAPASFTPEQLFAHCRPEGVTRITLIQMSYYRFDNRYMLDSMAAHPGVFSGVAIIDENAADVRGRMKDLAKQGVRGFRLNPGKQSVDAWLGSPGMAEMWKVGAEEGLSMCLLINPETLAAVDKMCIKYPQTPVVIDHFARIGMAGAVSRAHLDRLRHLATHAKAHVKTSAFYALGQKKAPYLDMGPMIRELRDSFGAERLMWASDCPFQVDAGHTYHDSIALIRDRLDFLSASDKAWMLRKTAEKVFFS
ncbi:MAG: amidohydrolase family protein [Prosthecobacter sp.]|nr:amidohydrolase family protein [Prosthecobacter sp.]